ncbi:hypothetical protein K443DRAFT_9858 [Laccaria amethystina LaAM-08-1]|uniref:Uncharacterized protein n=1 Tax=Laccaria amethystina LaAM-08-1 TaxID=1095629 RepID=A0A0C9X849_9AGAR|nr:hypothetical protein K443DRAFT_9858 [Laccaria amethystina LaAM-08-1]
MHIFRPMFHGFLESPPPGPPGLFGRPPKISTPGGSIDHQDTRTLLDDTTQMRPPGFLPHHMSFIQPALEEDQVQVPNVQGLFFVAPSTRSRPPPCPGRPPR